MRKNKQFTQVRVTRLADERVALMVEQMKAQGLSASKTSYLSALIMSQPLPTPTAKRRATKPAESTAGVGAAV